MNIESVREYCLSLPQTTEDFPFDESTLAFRIEGKIFAMVDLEKTEWFVLKCNPERALELRDRNLTDISKMKKRIQEIKAEIKQNKKNKI